MESLINQMRGRVSRAGQENKEESGIIRDGRLPPQRTQSFKGERKKIQNWFQRQFSRLMSQNNDSNITTEYPTAVAAAALAIRLLDESSIQDQGKISGGPDTSLTKIKSKTEETTPSVSEPRTVSIKSSDEASGSATKGKMPDKAFAPSIKKTPTFADKQLDSTASAKPGSARPEKAVRPAPAPSIKKTPTLADKLLEDTPKLDLASSEQTAFAPSEIKRQSSIGPRTGYTEADAWEKAEMAKIKERHEKLRTTIANWEKDKKTKAKSKLNRTEAKLDVKRGKALQHYRSEIARIDKAAGGAMAQAEENRRNKEFKEKDKASRIRATGKLPATCLCF